MDKSQEKFYKEYNEIMERQGLKIPKGLTYLSKTKKVI